MNICSFAKFTIIIFCIVFFVECKEDSPHENNNMSSNEVNFQNLGVFKIEDHIDSLHFLQLNAPFLFYSVPSKVRVFDDYIVYFTSPSYNEAQFYIFDHNGNLVNQIRTDLDKFKFLDSVSDFDVNEDKLYVLNAESIVSFDLSSPHLEYKIEYISGYFDRISSKESKFYLYSTQIGLALYENGQTKFIEEFNDELRGMSDLFPHFARYENQNLYFRNFAPDILTFSQNGVENYLSINLGDFEISDFERANLLRADRNFNELALKYVNEYQKFLYFNHVYQLDDELYLSWKSNGHLNMAFVKPNERTGVLFNRINNDSVFDFLTVNERVEYMPIYDVFEDGLVLVIEPDAINDKDYHSSSINSNWTEFNQIYNPNGNVILAFTYLK